MLEAIKAGIPMTIKPKPKNVPIVSGITDMFCLVDIIATLKISAEHIIGKNAPRKKRSIVRLKLYPPWQ